MSQQLLKLKDELMYIEEQIEMYADMESEESHATVEHFVGEQNRVKLLIKELS